MERYFQNNAVSQSLLKQYLMHPRLIHKESEPDLYYGEDRHFTKGSLVDLIVTGNWEDTVPNVYHVVDESIKLSDTVRSILHRTFDIEKESSLEGINFASLVTACNEHSFYMNRYKEDVPAEEDWRVKTILKDENSLNYWNELYNSQGKILLTNDEYEKSFMVANSIINDKYTYPFFSDMEAVYQKEFYTDYDLADGTFPIPIKGLCDVIFLDHKNGIKYITDIKTTAAHLANFNKSIFKFRYDIQVSFYKELAALCGFYPEYETKTQIFASSYADPGSAEIYYFRSEILDLAKYGNLTDITRNRDIVGWLELLKRYVFHEVNGFKYSKDYVENGGKNIVSWL